MNTGKSDQELIQNALSGDQQAFQVLVERYSVFAYNLAFRMMKEHRDAEEAAQDSFVKAYRSLSGFDGNSRFGTWLYTIVYRECLNRLSKKKLYLEEIDDHSLEKASDLETGLQILEREDSRTLIQQALLKLNPIESAVMTMYYLEGLKMKEISEVINKSESNIKVILYRGRKNLLQAVKSLTKLPLNEWI